MQILILILILIFGINLNAKEKLEKLLQALPAKSSYFNQGEIHVYDKHELGASVEYKRISLFGSTIATVYAYDLGTNKITNSITEKSYEMGINDIYEANTDIKLINKGIKTIHIQNINHEIHYSMFQLLLKGEEKVNSYIFTSGNQDYIYKIRISTDEKNMHDNMIEFSFNIISLLLSMNGSSHAGELEDLTRACNGGNAEGCSNLGLLYEKGKVVKQDSFKAA